MIFFFHILETMLAVFHVLLKFFSGHNCLHMPRGGTWEINKAFVRRPLALAPVSSSHRLLCVPLLKQQTRLTSQYCFYPFGHLCYACTVCLLVVSFQVCVHMAFTVWTQYISKHKSFSLSFHITVHHVMLVLQGAASLR